MMAETEEKMMPSHVTVAPEKDQQPPSEPVATPLAQPVPQRVTKPKDPKKVAAGRAGAAARKAKQERLLEELRGAKEKLHDTNDASDGGTPDVAVSHVTVPHDAAGVVAAQRSHVSVTATVAEQRQHQQHVEKQHEQEHHGNLPGGQRSWIPWIIGGCLAGGIVVVVSLSRRQVASSTTSLLPSHVTGNINYNGHDRSNKKPASTMLSAPSPARPAAATQRQQDKPRGVKQLENSPDPFYME